MLDATFDVILLSSFVRFTEDNLNHSRLDDVSLESTDKISLACASRLGDNWICRVVMTHRDGLFLCDRFSILVGNRISDRRTYLKGGEQVEISCTSQRGGNP